MSCFFLFLYIHTCMEQVIFPHYLFRAELLVDYKSGLMSYVSIHCDINTHSVIVNLCLMNSVQNLNNNALQGQRRVRHINVYWAKRQHEVHTYYRHSYTVKLETPYQLTDKGESPQEAYPERQNSSIGFIEAVNPQ